MTSERGTARTRFRPQENQMKPSSSKDRKIQWWLARLQEGLGNIHAGYCKCKACHAAQKLREAFENLNEGQP
jgi:hypothetical protein